MAFLDAVRFALRPPRQREIRPQDKWFYTRRWQRAERDADADMRAGRYEDFADMDEVIDVLKQNDPTSTAQLNPVDRVAAALRRFRRRW